MIKIRLDIVRQDDPQSEPYLLHVMYESENDHATLAKALTDINSNPERRDCDGKGFEPVAWQESCHQRKCGACAMRINHVPSLACGARLSDYGDAVMVEPLKKFPIVKDLLVDRSILWENLKQIRAWLEEDVSVTEEMSDFAFKASGCLQCGCCLEVCPNFYAGGDFFGMAAMVPVARLLSELPKEKQVELRKEYRKHVYNGCGKSLACRKICPAGLPVDELLIASNAIAVWKRIYHF